MITEQQATEHWQFLEDSSPEYGILKARVEAKEHLAKQYWSQAFLDAGGPVKERECRENLDPRVIKARGEYEDAVAREKTLWAQRKSAELAIAMWQTLSANNRQGVVI